MSMKIISTNGFGMITGRGTFFLRFSIFLFFISCIEKDVYEGNSDNGLSPTYEGYIYPYGDEVQDIVTVITLETVGEVNRKEIAVEIPFLKYNKSWLFMLTQDDTKQAAYTTTWAAINGKPLSHVYYYGARQLAAGDLPPDAFSLNKTLGSTDGTGKEIRFAFTTTLSPESGWMDAKPTIEKGNTRDYFRFSMKNGLTWDDVSEMILYGTGIAFHNVNTKADHLEDSIRRHYALSQEIIKAKLSGRSCKILAEPDGKKAYLAAALNYEPIQLMTAQSAGGAVSVLTRLFPFTEKSGLKKETLFREFFDSPYDIVPRIEEQLRKEKKEEREAINVGVHNTTVTFAQFLLWLNNRYGKDGDDSVWFPSLEEYYEYNHYRTHASITHEVEDNKVKLRIVFPSGPSFYFPSITVNLSGIKKAKVKSIMTDDVVTGFSYTEYDDGLMLNIDCRKFLLEQATWFVEKFESAPSQSNRTDALYFVQMLKDSTMKDELLKRIEK